MSHLYTVVISVIGLLTVVPTLARDQPSQSPFFKQFEVDQYNNIIRPYDLVDKQRSEIIVENLEYLRLECHANYPVQWVYTGNGMPIMNTDISLSSTLSTTESRNGNLNKYVASAFLGPLNEKHTGKYQCSRTDYVTVTPNLYIYVPGQDLFISPKGKTIKINANVTSIPLPCSVSHPSVEVTLYKLDGGKLTKPETKSNDAIVYDPRKGYRINLRKIENPEGRYICTARYNDLVRDLEYTITSQSSESVTPPPDNYEEFKQRAEETCTGESCKQCETHTDCPPLMNCYVDHKCRDSCSYSINCGKAAMCRVIDYRPQCYCPPGFVGDATKECLNISRERYERHP